MNKKGLIGGIFVFAIFCFVIYLFAAICIESQNYREECELVASQSYGGEYECNIEKLMVRPLNSGCVCNEKIIINGGYELGNEKLFKLNEDI